MPTMRGAELRQRHRLTQGRSRVASAIEGVRRASGKAAAGEQHVSGGTCAVVPIPVAPITIWCERWRLARASPFPERSGAYRGDGSLPRTFVPPE
jgi:hypothetical protein